MVSYSTLKLRMTYPVYLALSRAVVDLIAEDAVRGVATIVANRVIDAYRHATRTPWVRRIAPAELLQVQGDLEVAGDLATNAVHLTSPPGGVTPLVIGLDEAWS